MSPRTEWLVVCAIALLGLSLRVAYVIGMQDNPLHHDPIMDSAYHVQWARALAAGEPFAPLADRPFFRAPLYVWWLAGIFTLFGDGLLAPRLLQCGLGALSVVLVYLVGRRAFEPLVGAIAALLAATYWVLIYFDAELLIPTLIVPLDLLALWLTLGLARDGRASRAAGAGFVWGVSAIARPNVLLFAPFVAVWLLWRRRPRWSEGLLPAAAFGVALLAPILPITAYNTFVQGDFVLISSQGGVNLWIGNNPDADGVTAIAPGTRAGWWEGYHDTIALAEQAEGRTLRASEVSRHYARRAFRFLWNDPGRSLPLLGEKLRLFWTAWEYGNNQDVHFFAHRYSWVPRVSIGFALLAPLGLLGALLSLRDSRLFPLWGFLAVYTLSVVAFFVCSRFRVPVLPVLMVFAAHAGVWLWRSLRARRFAVVTGSACLLFAFGAWSAQRAPGERAGSNGHVQLAVAEAQQGHVEEAIAHLQRALEIEPNQLNARVKLGWAERVRGNPEAAALHFERALVLGPLRADALEGLLDTLVVLGRLDEAERWIDDYLALLVRREVGLVSEIPYYHRGRILVARGQTAAAREAFAEATRRDARSLRVALAEGDLERDAARWPEAAAAYERATLLLPAPPGPAAAPVPELPRAYRGLVGSLRRAGREREACRHAERWQAQEPRSDVARRIRARACASPAH